MKTKTLPPFAPTLIESTRAIGYSLEAAVADIIDNSIAASATAVNIFFFPYDRAGAYISILDNGKGMCETELDRAMQYGSRSPIETRDSKDLGRFGLGLKTASLSQCRTLTVVTKQGDTILGRRWDIDHVSDVGDWSLLILEPNEINEVPGVEYLEDQKSGTLVVWQNLDRMKVGEAKFEHTLGSKIDSVRSHLSLVYHRYLSGEPGITKFKLSINYEPVLPADPFLKDKSTKVMDDEKLIIREQEIVVRPYILPHISRMTATEIQELGGKEGLRKQQGFFVYRNKRLLTWGTWFRMMPQGDLSKLARIQVDIPNSLDDLWTLDIKKSSALPPAEVRKNLGVIIERVAEKSKRTWKVRGKREVSDKNIHIWNRMRNRQGAVYYEINRDHPLVKLIIDKSPAQQKLVFSLLEQIERGLPLNQLYVDLNEDEKLINDQDQDAAHIKDSLAVMLDSCSNNAQRLALLDRMHNVEPFSSFPEVFESLRREINHG